MTIGQARPKTSPPDRRTRFRAEASSAREGTATDMQVAGHSGGL